MKLSDRLYRIRCWWRGYHCETPDIGRFRYDVSGVCCYCGQVGDGIDPNDDDAGYVSAARGFLNQSGRMP